MKNWIIKFKIDNNQEEYAGCLRVIDAIEDKQQMNAAADDFLKKVTYKDVDHEIAFSDAVGGGFAACEKGLPTVGEEDRCSFFFEINCAKTDDIINLIYYCLINDRIDGRGILCIKCQDKQSYNIRDFLSDMLIFEEIKEYYILGHREYSRINRDSVIRRNRRFSPVFKINQSEKGEKAVDYWRQPVQTFLKDVYTRIPIGESDSNFTVNYFLPHIAPLRLDKEYPKDVWKRGAKGREIQLLKNFVECFCDCEEGLGINAVRERYECWKSKEFFEKIKFMPLLAMYIFCLTDYHQKNKKALQDPWENIDQEIFDARDMAEGLLQILENIYHSEYQRGYFCFRIHNNTPERSGAYLKKEYPAYMESQSGSAVSPVNYLEMKVVDFSHQSIPEQFYKDFKKRMRKAEDAEKEGYAKISEEAAEVKVASFYDETTEFWKQYNALSENVIHHYGIQIFQSLIACYRGYFQVRSQSKAEFIPERDFYSTHQGGLRNISAIPGTQYDALIPLDSQSIAQNISMDVNLRYDNHLIDQYEICENKIKFNAESIKNVLSAEENNLPFQERKELSVSRMAEKFEEAIEPQTRKPEKKYIMHISARDIMITAVEIFCKTVMLYIAKNGRRQDCYIMITECTQSHFVELARMMALFYNKQGQNPLMGRTQIFMSGDDEGEEFLITGTNLEEAVAGTEKLAFARSVHPNCLNALRKSLKNHMVTGAVSPNDVINIVPFDMINYPGAENTLLESRMQKVLEQDVQSELFGCKLENLHVRIGSKIHIRTFYEAELLFHNNYYTLRFAYWLYNELNSDDRLKKDEPFVLVGYENYSEMLINELCNMFNKNGDIKAEYIIYEERSAGKFRGLKDFSQYKDAQFVIIVPINSTSTTHIKTTGFLEKTIRNSLSGSQDYRIDHKKILNYGIVLIGTDDKNMYWDRDKTDKNVIVSKIDGKKLKYYVEVQAQWESPLKCSACFPKNDYTEELPLVETNKESVVPMHAISMRRPHPLHNAGEIPHNEHVSKEEINRLYELSQVLVYRHIERNGNHFNYYFSTEKLWENEQIKNNIERWLKGQRGKLSAKIEYKVYDIIVAPLHYSNTVFVEEVNNWLFDNAALVLHFDADSEFRMNVRTKYSSIQQLYDNLCMDNEKSVINFHYIDDTIISGRTYQRMKSLIGSLVRRDDSSIVEINIFKSVVLLLNRMSLSSIKDYIDDQEYFMAYFNLNISSMRVNSDACVLCKKYEEWNKLSEQASLNEVYSHWKEKSGRIKCVPIGEYESSKRSGHIRHPGRAIQYMIASHKAKKLLDEICDYAGTDEIIEEIVKELFPERVFPSPDEFIAMLKILGRPFMTFRREEKEAVFKLMLVMIEALLGEEEPEGEGKLQKILREIYNDSKTHIIIVNMLINRLAELESNYIIRKNSMEKILAFAKKHIEDPERYEKFIANYLNRIKQLIGQSNDLAKGLYLEYLLLYGQEYNNMDSEDMISLAGDDRDAGFRRKVYLENTKLANYGIEYLADCFWSSDDSSEESMKDALNSNYYFDNFIQYLAFHKAVKVTKGEKVESFVSQEELKKLQGMVRFELLYQRIFGRKKISGLEDTEPEEIKDHLQDKFGEMMEYLKAASGALDGEIIVPYEKDKEITDGIPKYIALGLKKGGDISELTNKDENLLEFMRKEREFEGDTYSICGGERKNRWVLFKFYNKTEADDNNATDIYMLLVFGEKNEGELLHAIKNILIFRNKIWRILNLSNDVLLQNLTDNLFYKQQMLKSRATGHMELSAYIEHFKDICKLISADEFTGKSGEEKKLVKEYFELLVNSMIGFMNAQVLGGKGADYAGNTKTEEFLKFWTIMQNEVKAAEKVWELQIVLRDGGKKGRYTIRKMENGKTPVFQILLILFLVVFQNIQKHKETNEKGIYEVFIYAEETGVYIKNLVSGDDIEKVKKSIRPEAYRAGEGISLAVIYDICRAYYPGIRYSEMFFLQTGNYDKNGGKEYEFVVKLPIIE